jgi:hypothetical protein
MRDVLVFRCVAAALLNCPEMMRDASNALTTKGRMPGSDRSCLTNDAKNIFFNFQILIKKVFIPPLNSLWCAVRQYPNSA